MAKTASRLGIFVALLLALFFAAQSVYLSVTVNTSLPSWDVWSFIKDYYRYLDGTYDFADLFNNHNEHIIFTTRIVLFLDAILFNLDGSIPLLLAYLSLLAIAAILACLAVGTTPRSRWLIATVVLLGLTWSLASFDNLFLEFNIVWLFVHLFALLCCLAVARALTATSVRSRALWYVGAFLADFLSVFSMASGIVTVLPVIMIAVWLRRIQRPFVALLVFHASLVLVYIHNGSHRAAPQIPRTVGLRQIAVHFLNYLGNCLAGWGSLHLLGSAAVLLFLVVLGGWATWRVVFRRATLPAETAVLLATAAFVVCEAAITTYGRVSFGADQGSDYRYGTSSIVLMACTFVLAWKIAGARIRAVLPALYCLVLWGANADQPYVYGWDYRAQVVEEAAFALMNGTVPLAKLHVMQSHPDQFIDDIHRAIRTGLGPFSPSASKYRPPLNYLLPLDRGSLPACTTHIDSLSTPQPDIVEIRGWAFSPSGAGNAWLMAYGEGGALIGLTRTLQPRIDVAAAFRAIGDDRIGFDMFLDRGRIHGDVIRLVLLPAGGKLPTPCAFPLKPPA